MADERTMHQQENRPRSNQDVIRRAAPDHPKQGVLTDRQEETTGQVLPGATAQSKADMMHDALEASATPSPWFGNVGVQPFGKDSAGTGLTEASEAAHLQAYPDLPSVRRKIAQGSRIPAVDLRRGPTASRA